MARNVEIKIKLDQPPLVEARLRELQAEDRGVISQTDTYFHAEGRLKLREQTPGVSELISYFRDDLAEARLSSYEIVPVIHPGALKQLLKRCLGLQAEVSKKRHLFILGRTRVHLDQVVHLGAFLELEVVLEDGDSVADGNREAAQLLRQLGQSHAAPIAGSYLDLILRSGSSSPSPPGPSLRGRP